jgi:lipopolysaccharide biosynthesis protein
MARGSRVAVLAHWSVSTRATRSACALVHELQSFGYRVVVISGCETHGPLVWDSTVDVDELVVIRKPNIGYDFGSWSLALAMLPDLAAAERMILVNDSMAGPFTSLRPLLEQFDHTTADVWGLTDTRQFRPHLQSYFLGFCDGVLVDRPLREFWADIRDETEKLRIVFQNEIGLSRLLQEEGYVQVPAFPHELFADPGENPVIKGWERLLEGGFPFLKREILRHPAVAPAGHSAPSVVKRLLDVEVSEWVDDRPQEGKPVTDMSNRAEHVVAGHVSRIRQVLRPRTRWRAWRGRLMSVVTPPVSVWPADFGEWIRRARGPRLGGFPESWRSHADLPIRNPSRVCVIVHAFYADLLGELFERIRRIPVDYDLFVTNVTGGAIDVPADMGPLRNVRVLDMENHGRDILPLVSLVNAGYLDPYLVVLKVHTKRSQWRSTHADFTGDGDRWRADLLHALLGETENIMQILSAFAEQPDLGFVTADGSVLGPERWGDNEANVANLLRRLELHLEPSRLRFPAGSMYWARGFVLQGLRALNLSAEDFEPEQGQVNLTTAHAIERVLGVLAGEAGLSIVERSALKSGATLDGRHRLTGDAPRPRARILPFYLPQFHTVPENDRWWGDGFTEWTNVTAAQPTYEGHYQPRFPRDLGFYDLRLDEVRRAQYTMSMDNGIAGFMYYYYWFAGKRLLDAPIEALVKSDIPQPFCIMWANENWTRRWDGRESDVLIAQHYESVPADDFIDDILPFLSDERYMTIDGRKIVAIYRPAQIPDLAGVVATWRKRARAAGVGDLFVLNVDVEAEFHGLEGTLASNGLDGSLGFPPHNHLYSPLQHEGLGVDPRFRGNILSYEALVKAAEQTLRSRLEPELFPGVMAAFDNTPRRQWAPDVWYGSNPYTFRRWLATAVNAVMDRARDERLVFVNAWNEWAEGAVLEPNDRFGRTFLLAIRDVTLG